METLTKTETYQPLETLEERMAEEKEKRNLIIQYFRSQMQANKHYYLMNGNGVQNGKPDVNSKYTLSKEGALNLATLFRTRPVFEAPIVQTAQNALDPIAAHLTVTYRCLLINESEQGVAEGVGVCSTMESKYRYRWVFENELPPFVDKMGLLSKKVGRDNKYTKYRVENPNPTDNYNTVYKMAKKRALVDAALQLPLVSELFTHDYGDPEEADPSPSIAVPQAAPSTVYEETEEEKKAAESLFHQYAHEIGRQKVDTVVLYVTDHPENKARAYKKALIQFAVEIAGEQFKADYEKRLKAEITPKSPAQIISDYVAEAYSQANNIPF